MDPVASSITIVSSTLTLARHVKQLYHSVKEQDENAKKLEDKLESLRKILESANDVYGQDESGSYSPGEQKLRQAVEEVVHRCNGRLSELEVKLEKLAQRGNPVSVAWKQQTNAPAVEKIGRSISEDQDLLSKFVGLLNAVQLDKLREVQERILDILQAGAPLSRVTLSNTSTDQLISEATATLLARGDAGSSGIGIPEETGMEEEGSRNSANGIPPEDPKMNSNGRSLLKAIDDGNHDTFASLLRDPETSLKEMDGKNRTPLLLAADLGKADMIEMLLAESDTAPPPILSNENGQSNTNIETVATHRVIDLTATDKNGRNALHYCAVFDLCDTVTFLLDRGVDVNARDEADFPAAYYAAKHRKYKAMRLLLTRGATTDFDWPTTSLEIEQLRDKAPNNDDQAASVS